MKVTTVQFLILGAFSSTAQVGIGTLNPSPASMLEIHSKSSDGTYKGLMPPRVASIDELNSISNTATADDIGLLIFYNDPEIEQCLKIWDGGDWKNVYCITTNSESAVVSFANAKQTITESSGGIPFDFEIINPSPFNSLILTISASDYANLEEESPVSVTISRGYNTFSSSSIFTYIDNTLIQENESIVFTITSVTGGDGTPEIGETHTHTVGIIDDDIKLWINEFRYENIGRDVAADEFVEVAGNAYDITGYQLYHYNGADGRVIRSVVLEGTIPDEEAGYGTISTQMTLQNGPDAIALVDPLDNVLQFISYEGSFTATEGPAAGMSSVDIGVSMPGNTPMGQSLQLTGTGNAYEDFDWEGPKPESPSSKNSGQTFN